MVLFVTDRENSASGRVCRGIHTDNGTNFTSKAFLNETIHQGVKVNTMAGLIGGAIQVAYH